MFSVASRCLHSLLKAETYPYCDTYSFIIHHRSVVSLTSFLHEFDLPLNENDILIDLNPTKHMTICQSFKTGQNSIFQRGIGLHDAGSAEK